MEELLREQIRIAQLNQQDAFHFAEKYRSQGREETAIYYQREHKKAYETLTKLRGF